MIEPKLTYYQLQHKYVNNEGWYSSRRFHTYKEVKDYYDKSRSRKEIELYRFKKVEIFVYYQDQDYPQRETKRIEQERYLYL